MQFKILALTAGALLWSASAASAAVVTNPLHLRSRPTVHSSVVATMPAGTYVRIIDCLGGWCRVAWRGVHGFANVHYLAAGGPAVEPAPVVVEEPPPVYVAPEPVFSFGFGFGSGWHHHHWFGHHGFHHGFHHASFHHGFHHNGFHHGGFHHSDHHH
jgi:uncharacterized protein YraI